MPQNRMISGARMAGQQQDLTNRAINGTLSTISIGLPMNMLAITPQKIRA